MNSSLLVLFALVALGGAVQGQKLFHLHYEDFQRLVLDEVGDVLDGITEQYLEHDEFINTLLYLQTKDFKDLIYEMEDLPEFKTVVEFLEKNNVDIDYFINILNEALENINGFKRGLSRQQISGTDFNSYTKDITAAFPKDKLSALYDQKMEEDVEFRTSMENLKTDEWDQVFTTFWESATFQEELKTLDEHGLDLKLVIDQIVALFGQL